MFEMNNLDDSLFSKINKKEDFLEDIIKNVDIVGYNLKTEKFGIKGNYIPGFMGKVNIKVKGLSLIHILGAATVSPDVIDGLIKLDEVECAVDAFIRDFEGVCGQDKTMINI